MGENNDQSLKSIETLNDFAYENGEQDEDKDKECLW